MTPPVVVAIGWIVCVLGALIILLWLADRAITAVMNWTGFTRLLLQYAVDRKRYLPWRAERDAHEKRLDEEFAAEEAADD